MKKLLPLLLALIFSLSFGATLTPIQLLNPAGSTSGQVLTSSGPSTALTWTTPTAAPVTSVATRTGAIVLSNTDVSGLGTASIVNTGTSGATIPLLNGANTWGLAQTFSVPTTVPSGGTGVATLTGLVIGNGTSAMSAYGGTSCTNQFPRSLNASGVAACASVANADLSNSSVTVGSTSVSLGATASTIAGLTLTAPVVNSPTGIAKGDIGLANVDNTSDATKNSATATLTNKTFDTAAAGNVLMINGATISSNTGTGANVLATSPTLTGTVTIPTPNAGDNTTKAASTAFVNTIFASPPAIGSTTPAAGTFTTLGVGSANNLAFGTDTFLQRDGSGNALGLYNGTSAQALSIYNTRTDGSNYERGIVRFNSNNLQIGTEAAGTGTSRTLYLVTNGNGRWFISGTNSHLQPNSDNAADLGQSGQRVRNSYQAGIYVNNGTNVAVPTTGQTVTVAQTTNAQIVDPAGTLAAVTIQFPIPLADGHAFELSITQTVTALTLTPNSGASIKGGFTSVTTYLATKYRYNSSNTTWYEVN